MNKSTFNLVFYNISLILTHPISLHSCLKNYFCCLTPLFLTSCYWNYIQTFNLLNQVPELNCCKAIGIWHCFSFNSIDFPGGSNCKETTCNADGPGSISGLRRSLGEGQLTPIFLLGESPWTEEHGGMQCMQSQS